MPIYEYECKKCGEEFEKLVMSGDEVRCPKCGSSQVARRMSGFSTGPAQWGITPGPSSPPGCGGSGGFS